MNIMQHAKGWVVGNFVEARFKDSIEIGIKSMSPGELNPIHGHAKSIEYTYLIRGDGILISPDGVETVITAGSLLKIDQNEYFGFRIPQSQAYNTDMLVVKTASFPDDKILWSDNIFW